MHSCCTIVNCLKSLWCNKLAASCSVFLQVSRLLGAFKNQKQVTRSFGSAVSMIVPFPFSFKKFLKKESQKLTFIRLLLLILSSQK